MKSELEEITKVVAVMSYGRGGSGLWSSLLDHHPNVLSIPDTILMNFYRFWERENCEKLSLTDLLNLFIDHFYPMFNANDYNKQFFFSQTDLYGWRKLGEERNECLYADKKHFKELVLELFKNNYPLTRSNFIKAIHLAYAKCIGQELEYPLIISFGLHVPSIERNQAILEDFPNTYFLQTIRNPVIGFSSWLKCYNFDYENGIDYKACIEGFPYMLKGVIQIVSGESNERWKAVKLEDVHNKPQETVEKVTKWLSLPWNDSLLESTWNGKKFWNEKNTIQISGFSKEIIKQKHKGYISWLDKIRFKVLFYKHNNTWEYPHRKIDGSFLLKIFLLPLFLLPFKMEIIALKHLKLKGHLITKLFSFCKEFIKIFIDTRKVIWDSYKYIYDKNAETIKLL